MRRVAYLTAVLLALSSAGMVARADAEPAAPLPDPNSHSGGTTLQRGNFIWLRPSLGYDMFTALLAAEVGYARSLAPEVDASIALAGNLGFATAVGTTLRLRWSALHYGNFHMAVDLPFSNAMYPDGESPHLRIVGVEPGVMMSNVFDDSFGIFYGSMLRVYYAASTYFVGPQARLGAGFSFKELRLALAVNASHVAVTNTPAMTLFSLDLLFGYAF